MSNSQKTVSRQFAEKEVITTARRLAALYYHFIKVLEKELGEEKAREITEKVILNYGRESGERAGKIVKEMGLSLNAENFSKGSDLPSLGWKAEKKESNKNREVIKITYCPLAEFWKEKGFKEMGRLYCFVDQAKYSAYNSHLECVHGKNVLDGDECCELIIEDKNKGENP